VYHAPECRISTTIVQTHVPRADNLYGVGLVFYEGWIIKPTLILAI